MRRTSRQSQFSHSMASLKGDMTFLSLSLGTASRGRTLQAASSRATSVSANTSSSTEAEWLRAMQARWAARVPSSACNFGK